MFRLNRNKDRNNKAVVMAAVASLLLGSTSAYAAVERVSGSNRYQTSDVVASKAADSTKVNGKHIVFVRGDSFADALSASALAGSFNGVIMLLPPEGALSTTVQAKVKEATKIYILGGTKALPANLETIITQLNPTVASQVKRIAGPSRVETATNLAVKLVTPEKDGGFGWHAKKVSLVNIGTRGGGADALAAAPLLGSDMTVMLPIEEETSLPQASSAFIKANQNTIKDFEAVGGTKAVAPQVLQQVQKDAGVEKPEAETKVVSHEAKTPDVWATLQTTYQGILDLTEITTFSADTFDNYKNLADDSKFTVDGDWNGEITGTVDLTASDSATAFNTLLESTSGTLTVAKV